MTDEEILRRFPEYDGNPKHYVGSREYWRNVFSREKNRDPELHKAFGDLQERIVNEVIRFCRDHDLDVNEFSIRADGLRGSKPFGEWKAGTDSCMEMFNMRHDPDLDMDVIDRENPFLHRH